MKYWVYKDSAILGPFDKTAFAGLPGVDASTLVCAGEAAADGEGDWLPAGDVADLSALTRDRGPAWPSGEGFSALGMLDKLQLDTAGLVGDDEFPGAAEDLFQDADMQRAVDSLFAPRAKADAEELSRARHVAAELSSQLDLLHKRVAELETGQTDLARQLAEKQLELGRKREREAADATAVAAAVAAPVAPFVPEPAPPAPFPPVEPPTSFAPPPPVPLPVLSEPVAAVAPAEPAPEIPALAPPLVRPVPSPLPTLTAAVEEPPAPEPPTKKIVFEKKTFKIVPVVKSFRVVGPEEGPAAGPVPASEPAPEAPPPTLEIVPPAEETLPVPAPAPVPAPLPVPLATFSFGDAPPPQAASAPMPAFSSSIPAFTDSVSAPGAAAAPPATAVFQADDSAARPSTQEVLSRLAKPAPAPATAAPRRPRSNKPFLIGAGTLVVVLAAAGVLFLRHPKDLKQMTELDDGRARVGAEPTDDASRPPLVKPPMAAPPSDSAAPLPPPAASAPAATTPAPAPAPVPAAPSAAAATQAASQAKLDAAIAAVKGFPLDGERGTVAQWLQFSYSASPDAGQEAWSASETADKTYLVEYRFTPARGGEDVHYLFEADMDRGLVLGKNLDAKSVLAGGPRGGAPAAKPKAKPRKAARKPVKKTAKKPAKPAAAAPKDVPLLPLPSDGELKPPAEDDGAFSADTVNSGL